MSDETDKAASLDFYVTAMRIEHETGDPLAVACLPLGGELLAMLRELEWVPVESDDGGHEECPCCRVPEWKKHAPDCRLDALLRRYKR